MTQNKQNLQQDWKAHLCHYCDGQCSDVLFVGCIIIINSQTECRGILLCKAANLRWLGSNTFFCAFLWLACLQCHWVGWWCSVYVDGSLWPLDWWTHTLRLVVYFKQQCRKNRRERLKDRNHEPEMIDGQMLWFIMHHFRRSARRRVSITWPYTFSKQISVFICTTKLLGFLMIERGQLLLLLLLIEIAAFMLTHKYF